MCGANPARKFAGVQAERRLHDELGNRTRFTSSLKNELLEQFDQLARETRIPKSRLFDEAIEDLLKKYAEKDL